MKIKTINKVLQKKFDDWMESITDPVVKELLQKNCIITGGCIASMLMREEVNDYDIYFRTREAAIAAANYYLGQMKSPLLNGGKECPMEVDTEMPDRIRIIIKSAGIVGEGAPRNYRYFEQQPTAEAGKYVSEVIQDPGAIEDAYTETEAKALEAEDEGKPKFRPVFMSTNAVTLSHKIQIVLRFYGEPDDIHKNYDFVHCTNYWSSWDSKLVLHQVALESILSKELRYVGSKYPVCSVIRLRKFIARQWTINAGQILKMLMQINELDLTDFAVLQDQLTGVDCAYFCEVLEDLKSKDPTKINSAYLVEIIDRIF